MFTPSPTAAPTPVRTEPLEPVILEISHQRDITLIGFNPYDKSGSAVAVGDLNRDGVPDLAVGAVTGSPGGRVGTGQTYVLFGPLLPGTHELVTAAHVTFNGINPDDRSGAALAIGDLNGDGAADLAVGAYGARGSYGQTYVVFGPLAPGVFELADVADITLNGVAHGDNSGYALAMGDLNSDGAPDLAVGAIGNGKPGKAHVVFGPLAPGVFELADVANITLHGSPSGDSAGSGLAVGDLNGDGAPDLAVGAGEGSPAPSGATLSPSPTPRPASCTTVTCPRDRELAGKTYVVFGPLVSGTYELATKADVTLDGIAWGDQSGWDVAVEDLNGDGAPDLAIGATWADPGGRESAGETYVVFGPLSPGTYDLATEAGITVNGINSGDYSGYAVEIGDVNGDGAPDLVIGAYWATPELRVRAGETYVIFGPLPKE